MGARGPIPNRSDQRRRRNKPEGGEPDSAPSGVAIVQPAVSEEWHPLARDWYLSLAASGQAVFYEASDWQQARVWAEVLSRQLLAARISAPMMAAWSAGATELLTTEGARRRMRLELERAKPDDPAEEHGEATVTHLFDALSGGA